MSDHLRATVEGRLAAYVRSRRSGGARWFWMTPQDAPLPDALPDAARDAALAKSRAMIEAQMALVGAMSGVGVAIVLALERAVAPPAANEAASARAPVDVCAVSLAYARVSKAVRMAVMLQMRLHNDLQQPGVSRQWDAERVVAVAGAEASEPSVEREGTERGEGSERERAERLEDDELYAQVMRAPVTETIDRIRGDLGLTPEGLVQAEAALAADDVGALLKLLKPTRRDNARPRRTKPPERWRRAASG